MAGWENVAQNNGVSIAIAGIVVVFCVLTIISGFIALLPKALSIFPEPDRTGDSQTVGGPADAAKSPDAAIAAAAGFAFHLEANAIGDKRV